VLAPQVGKRLDRRQVLAPMRQPVQRRVEVLQVEQTELGLVFCFQR
jgi:hypothetical protein